MEILYIASSFPKPNQGSTIYTDLAEALLDRGHKLTVIVSSERKYTSKTCWSSERGCRVLRVKTGNIYDVGFIEKGISILTMEYIVKLAIKYRLKGEQYDLIIYEAPPVTNCGIVKYAKRIFGAKTYLMLKDIFPQNAVDIGIIKKESIIYRIFKRKEKNLYSVSDIIGCMSQGNKDYILEHNPWIKSNKVEIFPNTKKVKKLEKGLIDKCCLKDKYSIPKEAVIFLFGGNMGKPQGIDFLCESIRQLKDERDIFILLVGRGTEKEKIKEYIKRTKCENAKVIDNLPRDQYEDIANICDVGLVLLDYRFTIPNYPSRILSYMEKGIPVLAATDINTDFRKLIEDSKCGLWCPSNDVGSFCENIKTMAKNYQLRKSMGLNGRSFLEKNLDVDVSVEIIEKLKEDLKGDDQYV